MHSTQEATHNKNICGLHNSRGTTITRATTRTPAKCGNAPQHYQQHPYRQQKGRPHFLSLFLAKSDRFFRREGQPATLVRGRKCLGAFGKVSFRELWVGWGWGCGGGSRGKMAFEIGVAVVMADTSRHTRTFDLSIKVCLSGIIA